MHTVWRFLCIFLCFQLSGASGNTGSPIGFISVTEGNEGVFQRSGHHLQVMSFQATRFNSG